MMNVQFKKDPVHTSKPNVRKNAHIPELDGIRGLAILLVLVWHYVGCVIQPGQRDFIFFVWKATSLAWCGVDLFFVLSGFLIGGILLDNKKSASYFRTFYLRRTARIFPPYYAVVFMTFALTWSGLADYPGSSPFLDGHTPLPFYLLYLQNFIFTSTGNWGYHPLALTWSLAVEEQFYLLLPFAIYFIPRNYVSWFLGCGVFVSWVVRITLLHQHSHPEIATYTLLITRCDSLFSGALLAWVIRQRANLLQLFQSKFMRGVILIILAGGYLILIELSSGPGSRQAAYWGYTWFSLTGVCLISFCLQENDSFIKKFFRSRLLRYFGVISYGLYLLHDIVHHFVFWILTGTSITRINNLATCGITLIAASLSVIMAGISWRYVERPLLQCVRQSVNY